MLKTLLAALAVAALAAAGTPSSYHFSLLQNSVVNGTELKPGEYKVELNGNKAVIRKGKQSVEATVKVENTARKNQTDVVRYGQESRVEEIRIGGTNVKLLFDTPSTDKAVSAGQ